MFYDSLDLMVQWWSQDEYSHGYLIPAIVIFLIWQKKDGLEKIPFRGSWVGLLLVVLGILFYYIGELGTVYTIIQYAFLVSLAGLVLAFTGWEAFKKIAIPLIILMFMIPLPAFIYNNLSAQLQLTSSQIGVAFIRAFGISVYLEGNVIDLGTYKLQVVEACSGLRYLFPLMTLGFIAAYFYKGAFWKRAAIFLSSIPITILMNSFRIGAIGVMVEYWGQGMAEGFLHDFEGWAVFMASIGVLVLEMWLFSLIGKERKPLREVFGLDFPEPSPRGARIVYRKLPAQFIVAFSVLSIAFVGSLQMQKRTEIIPDRTNFLEFPMQIGNWKGTRDQLEQIYIDQLKFDDYIIANYSNGNGPPVNFYIAYYGSQSKGQSAHSPRACLPGGGWQIKDLSQKRISEVVIDGAPLFVNRVEIRKGDVSQLVYYWFQEQGRVITNEYLVKWYLFWDAITKRRTDGALVRLTVFVPPGENVAEAEEQLASFVRDVSGHLGRFIPD
ncbi:MAG TPA: VPLPA-CTERM-specific exosortase XrtD [Gammaproteobacteria bacterium]|nr:VPLPA-CTERM-specific exosortase XrtD [Gammaproteobacteria bacterium]